MINFADNPLVETAWLAQELNKPGLRVVDARWRGDGTSSRELFQRGHIPGAVHLDWELDFSGTDETGLRYMLLPPAEFARVMETAGIGINTRVVAYADFDYSGAARLWWALRYYGHEQVAVLNGGWNKGVREGRPTSAGLSLAATGETANPFLTNTGLGTSLKVTAPVIPVRPPRRRARR